VLATAQRKRWGSPAGAGLSKLNSMPATGSRAQEKRDARRKAGQVRSTC
jgi:hypothetical protein